MYKKRKLQLCTLLSFFCLTSGTMAADQITNIEAVSQVFGDGEKLSSVILHYDAPIDAASVTTDDYSVLGRTITNAYVSGLDTIGKGAAQGPYVVVELEPLPMSDNMADPHPEDRGKKRPMGEGGPQLGSHGNPQPLPQVTAQISQVGLVKSVDGRLYGPTERLTGSQTNQLVVKDFKQGEMISPNTPVILMESKRYYYDIYVNEKQAALLHEGEVIMGTAIANGQDVKGSIRLKTQAPGFADMKMTREKGQADLTAFQLRIYTDPDQDILPGMTVEVQDDQFAKR